MKATPGDRSGTGLRTFGIKSEGWHDGAQKVGRWCRRVEEGTEVLIINTSYQKLPFGSGDDPDKLFFHQALN